MRWKIVTRRLTFFAGLLALLILLALRPTLAADAPPAGPIILHRQMIMDSVLQTNAYSILIPDTWKLESNISWGEVNPAPYVSITVTNADKHAQWRHFPRGFYVDGIRQNYMRAFPAQSAQIQERLADGKQTLMGWTIHKLPASPREFLEQILIPASCPDIAADKDAKVTAVTDMPDVAQTYTEHDPLHRPTQVSRVRFAYTTPAGPMETEFVCALAVSKTNHANGQIILGPDAAYFTEASSRTAPKGDLDALAPTFTAIESSLTQQLPWFNLCVKFGQEFVQRQQQLDQQMMQNQRDRIAAENKALQVQRDGINQRQQIMHDAAVQESNDVSDRIKQNFANQQAAKADAQTSFMHYVTNTASYKDPNDGSTITLSNYQYQYEDNHGDIIETNDATYRPPVDPSTSWQQMEKIN